MDTVGGRGEMEVFNKYAYSPKFRFRVQCLRFRLRAQDWAYGLGFKVSSLVKTYFRTLSSQSS